MTLLDYISYFETAAINHKLLLHNNGAAPGSTKRITFYEIDIEDILKALKLDNKYMSLLLESPEYRPSDAKSDNIRNHTTGAYVVVEEVIMGDKVDRRNKLEATRKVAQQIIAKIINDNKRFSTKRTGPEIKGFDVNSVRFQKVGPILTNHYGWRVEFTFNDTFENQLQLDEADWNNETKFSIL